MSTKHTSTFDKIIGGAKRAAAIVLCIAMAALMLVGCDDSTASEGAADACRRLIEIHSSGSTQDMKSLLPPGYYDYIIDSLCARESTETEAKEKTDRKLKPFCEKSDRLRVLKDDEYDIEGKILEQYNATDKETAQLADRLAESFGVKGEITNASLIVYSIDIKYSIDREDESTDCQAICVEIDGKWYVIDMYDDYSRSIWLTRSGLDVFDIHIQWIYDWFEENTYKD